jgi:hypothetical protein
MVMPSGYVKKKEKWKREIFSQPCLSPMGDASNQVMQQASKQHTHKVACVCCQSQRVDRQGIYIVSACSTQLLKHPILLIPIDQPRITKNSISSSSRPSNNPQETNQKRKK